MSSFNLKPFQYFLFFSFFFIFVPYIVQPLSFQFPYLDPTNPVLISNGSASASSVEIQLTNNQRGKDVVYSIGRAIYKDSVQIWDSKSGIVTNFTTHFSFTIKSVADAQPGESCYSKFGDGMAFFLAPNGLQIPSQSQGAFLGLLDRKTVNSSNQLVAVEFDTYRNVYGDFYYNEASGYAESAAPHIGIDVGSIFSAKVVPMSVNLSENVRINASITYDGVNQILVVRLAYNTTDSIDNISSIVDLKKKLPERVNVGFSASTGACIEQHTLYSWSFNSSLDLSDEGNRVNTSLPPISTNRTPEIGEKSKNNLGLVAGLSAGAVVLTCGCCLLWFVLRKRKVKAEEERDDVHDNFNLDDDFEKGTGPKRFNYKDLALATNNFSKDRKLGQGGFGGVYKGVLDGGEIAVKRISRGSKQGIKEYVSEVKIISQLRHKNLVQLLGWCHERGEFLLVYELMHNGSLDSHLFGKNINSPLPWEVRYNIASGLASALLYLHEEWEQCVVHRDIKSSNVMLDSSFNAKLGDFGLARFVNHNSNMETTLLAGTMGYMAPEYILTGKASKESDIYSFGIVALEIACGRKATDTWEESIETGLVEWVWDLYGNRKLLEAVDPKLGHEFHCDEVVCLMTVGLWCAHPDHSSRPSMKTVKDVLHMGSPLPILPSRIPMPVFSRPLKNVAGLSFSTNGGSTSDFLNTARVSSSSAAMSTIPNSSTVTLLEAR